MEIVRTHRSNLIVDPDRVYVKGPFEDTTLTQIARFAAACIEGDEKGIERYWDWSVELLPGGYATVTLYKD